MEGGRGNTTAPQSSHIICISTYAHMHGAECSIKHFLTENAHNSWVLPSKVLQKRDGHVGYNPRGCQLQEAENGTGG